MHNIDYRRMPDALLDVTMWVLQMTFMVYCWGFWAKITCIWPLVGHLRWV